MNTVRRHRTNRYNRRLFDMERYIINTGEEIIWIARKCDLEAPEWQSAITERCLSISSRLRELNEIKKKRREEETVVE